MFGLLFAFIFGAGFFFLGLTISFYLILDTWGKTKDKKRTFSIGICSIVAVLALSFSLNWPNWGPLFDVVGDWNRGQSDDMITPLGSGFRFYSVDIVKELPQPLKSRYIESDLDRDLGMVSGLACHNQKVYLKFDNNKIKHIEHGRRELFSDNPAPKNIQWLNIEKFEKTPCAYPTFQETLPWWIGLLIGPLVALLSLVAIVFLRPKAALV